MPARACSAATVYFFLLINLCCRKICSPLAGIAATPLSCPPSLTCRIWQIHTSPDFFRRALAWPVETDPLPGCHVHHNHKHTSIIMSKTAFVDFKAVKAAITMEQVLEHYGILDKFKPGTDSLNGPCPIHKGSNPTQFRVSLSKNIWNCFSECKHGGNVLDFIAEMENVSIHAAALKAIEWFNLDPETMAASNGKGDSCLLYTYD